MPQPTPQDVHVSAALSDFSIAYIQDTKAYGAGRALGPAIPVQKKTDKYFIFNKNDWRRDDAVKKRAPGERAPRSGFTVSTDSYDADAWWTEVPMSDMTRANADPAVPVDRVLTMLVTQRMLLRRERQFATTFMVTGAWATDRVGTTNFVKWDDYSSDPQKEIDDQKKTILVSTGRKPNKFIVGFAVHQALKRHPLIKDTYKYTSSESITEDMLAKFFEVDAYIVLESSYATNNEGGTAAYTGGNFNDALLVYNDEAPGIMTPRAMTLFAWTGLTELNSDGVAIDQYYEPQTKDDIVRGQFAHDMKITGADLGVFFSAAVG